jgi:hypothetical protein
MGDHDLHRSKLLCVPSHRSPKRHPAGPSVPLPGSLAQALDASESLGALSRRLSQSKQRWAVACETLPPALRTQVRSGVLDDEGWTLLASNAAAAAKLRHCVPLIEASLRQAGWPAVTLRIRLASA